MRIKTLSLTVNHFGGSAYRRFESSLLFQASIPDPSFSKLIFIRRSCKNGIYALVHITGIADRGRHPSPRSRVILGNTLTNFQAKWTSDRHFIPFNSNLSCTQRTSLQTWCNDWLPSLSSPFWYLPVASYRQTEGTRSTQTSGLSVTEGPFWMLQLWLVTPSSHPCQLEPPIWTSPCLMKLSKLSSRYGTIKPQSRLCSDFVILLVEAEMLRANTPVR